MCTNKLFIYIYSLLEKIDNTDAKEHLVYINTEETGNTNVDIGVFLYDADAKTFHSYDSPMSAATKAQYAVDNELRGVLTWLIENDLPADDQCSLISTVDQILSNA